MCLSCSHHVSSSCVCSDSLRLLHFPLSADHLLSYHPVLPPAHQLHLPGCGGQIPCALPLIRSLAPMPSTTLAQVMSPTTATSRRLCAWCRYTRGRFDSAHGGVFESTHTDFSTFYSACRNTQTHSPRPPITPRPQRHTPHNTTHNITRRQTEKERQEKTRQDKSREKRDKIQDKNGEERRCRREDEREKKMMKKEREDERENEREDHR